MEHADGSEMRISVMSLLDVASAAGRVAELFFRNRFGEKAVDMAKQEIWRRELRTL